MSSDLLTEYYRVNKPVEAARQEVLVENKRGGIEGFSPVEIKAIRASYDMTQKEFAAMTGISWSVLLKIEIGLRLPSSSVRALLALYRDRRVKGIKN